MNSLLLTRFDDAELRALLNETRTARAFATPRWKQHAAELAELEQALHDELTRRTTTRIRGHQRT